MEMNYQGIQNKKIWADAGISLPGFDWRKMAEATKASPVWAHFGAGNIFRGFIAVLQQRLLKANLTKAGIIAVNTNRDIIESIYTPYDNMTMQVRLRSDGGTEKEIIASVAQAICADSSDHDEWNKLITIFQNPCLQLVSFTITEWGYALYDTQGNVLPSVASDLVNGPNQPKHVMSMLTALILKRYEADASPLALVSMDNCSHNGLKLKESVLTVAHEWVKRNYVNTGFIDYLNDDKQVSFPWSMIDKITPRPAQEIAGQLGELGVSGMELKESKRGFNIAAFVNCEVPEYLVLEDSFPNGRPPLEKAGVYLTDRDTVNKSERMKVTTCLNPLHTALAVYGRLLGYESISAAIRDKELKALVERIGYSEGMPVVTDPGILNPKEFICEVIEERLPNPFIPDTPYRIATDTSQKVPIRFGETIKAYCKNPALDVNNLVGIPLALSGWLRYLLAIDNNGREIELSPDPMLSEIKEQMSAIRFGEPDSVKDRLKPILSNAIIFGIDLYKAGVGEKVENFFRELMAAPGAVRKTLKKFITA